MYHRKIRGKLEIGIVAVLIAALAVVAAPSAATASSPVASADVLTPHQAGGERSALAFPGPGPWVLHNARVNRCLDADTGTINGNGTRIQLWDCSPGATNQL